ncbi:methylated-DNA--[protein]-cysteine S-methyltransferase [Clostridium frigoris]|uniref:Methylated-DNA--protein-cysteine methyltransferase n=2 Tax=Clostridium frigoris TaxID=205327 RepID=A0ABS6BTL5_9CLOT|nr:methylated-DNA--[protein]-cysteine S-methyltransferase [Clostridium frigoris]MBU3160256.1 methylated-DNA--[protein]-cysteine S-methyltransferase [Clostridium frigoris]
MNFIEKMPKGTNINETVLLKGANRQLQEYFSGKRKVFDLPLAPSGTEFQQKVWHALREIPYGKTNSYKDIAKNIGNIKAARAVGMANNKNPILIFIPCHRVIGSNGKLVGYAGGLDVKEKLLNIEKENRNN